MYKQSIKALLAQLDRAPDFGSGGYRFNSYAAHHLNYPIFKHLFVIVYIFREGLVYFNFCVINITIK